MVLFIKSSNVMHVLLWTDQLHVEIMEVNSHLSLRFNNHFSRWTWVSRFYWS